MALKTLTIVFDVTDFTDAQIDHLELEASIQGEANDEGEDDEYQGHPEAEVVSVLVTETRT